MESHRAWFHTNVHSFSVGHSPNSLKDTFSRFGVFLGSKVPLPKTETIPNVVEAWLQVKQCIFGSTVRCGHTHISILSSHRVSGKCSQYSVNQSQITHTSTMGRPGHRGACICSSLCLSCHPGLGLHWPQEESITQCFNLCFWRKEVYKLRRKMGD
jgi:hypothetical protein